MPQQYYDDVRNPEVYLFSTHVLGSCASRAVTCSTRCLVGDRSEERDATAASKVNRETLGVV